MGKKEGSVSRRDFVRGGVLAGAGLTMAGVMGGCAPHGAPDKKSHSGGARGGLDASGISWDKETDVVAVGLGGAGGAAAIEANKGGAEVLVVEATSQGADPRP